MTPQGRPVLKRGAEANAGGSSECEERGHGEPSRRRGRKHWLAGDAIQRYRIQRRENVGGDFADGYGSQGHTMNRQGASSIR